MAHRSAAVLVPVKAFDQAKHRLAPALDAPARAALARSMATNVVSVAAPLPVWVVCDDDEVAQWAATSGATVLWRPGRGLNAAVADGVDHLAGLAFDQVIVAHADLPHALDLAWVADFDGVTLVPDRHDDGTNVACVPTGAGFTFAYGAQSFARHRRRHAASGWPCASSASPAWGGTSICPPTWPPPSGWRCEVGGGPESDLATPTAALAIAAHPDDIEFNAAATLAKWAAEGCVVHHLVLTDGSKGTWNPDEDIPALVRTRQAEQRAAAAALGATGEVVMLDNVDGELGSGLAERERVAYWIRVLRPQVVMGHDPWKRYRLHPDHRHAGWLTVDGIVAARDPFFFPEQGVAHHRPDRLLLFEADEPDHVEDVTGFEATKLAALLEHRSQFVTTMAIDDADSREQLQSFRDRVFDRMRQAAQPIDVTFAEAFKLIDRL